VRRDRGLARPEALPRPPSPPSSRCIPWLEKAHSANSELRNLRICLAAAYALKGETERAAAELVEAQSLVSDDRFSSVARLKTSGSFRVSECFRAPKIPARRLVDGGFTDRFADGTDWRFLNELKRELKA
jgi:hypothetical protein